MTTFDFKRENEYLSNLFAAARDILQEGIIEDDIYSFMNLIPESFDGSWTYGFSKFVLNPKNKPYVIKIPFVIGEDYCKIEEDTYNQIKRDNPEYISLFAKIEKNPLITDYDIYLQDKAVCFSDVNKFQLYHYVPAIDKLIRDNISKTLDEKEIPGQSAITWWMNVLSGYFNSDIQKFNKFIDFLHKNELDTDLHFRNVGYYPSNNLPVIFDYSGFQDTI